MLKEKKMRTSKLSLIQLCTAVSVQRNVTMCNAGCAPACNHWCNRGMDYQNAANYNYKVEYARA